MIPYLFALFLVSCVIFDYIFMQKSHRRLWKFIAGAFIPASALSLGHEHLSFITDWTGIGRPVDFFIYVSSALLIRELFLGRARDMDHNEKLTALVRELAHSNAKPLNDSATRSRLTTAQPEMNE